MDETQAHDAGAGPRPEPTAAPDAPAGAGDAPLPPSPPGPAALTNSISPQRGLVEWLGIVFLGSVLCLVLGHAEAALFFAGAGVFALAQASDAAVAFQRYRHWVRDTLPERSGSGLLFRVVVRSLVPVSGALLYLGLGAYAWQLGAGPAHRLAAWWSFAAAAASLALVSRGLADRLTALFFRSPAPGRTRRLTARLVLLGLLLPVPLQALLPELMQALRDTPGPLASPGALVAQLAGEVAIALAGVGWLVRRTGRETLERLGLVRPRPVSLLWVALGLAGAVGLNSGMEALQHAWFPGLWRMDQEATRLIAGDMPVWTALLLGLSAGFGEEVTLRGALQPRLGIVLTAVFFAAGHVQYSWWGMLTIALLGMLLGVVRRRTDTTTAIAVHMLYDVFAVVTSQGS